MGVPMIHILSISSFWFQNVQMACLVKASKFGGKGIFGENLRACQILDGLRAATRVSISAPCDSKLHGECP